jgi:hypothetical protein
MSGSDSGNQAAADRSSYTGNGGTTWLANPSQEFPGQYNDFAHKMAGKATWVMFHETDPDRFVAMRNQHMGKSIEWPPATAWACNNQDYSEFRSFGFHPTDYRRLVAGMTDRILTASDYGAEFVRDDALSDADKTAIKDLIAPVGDPARPTSITGRGVLMLTRGTRTGYIANLGQTGKETVPVAFGRSVTTTRTDTAATGNGTVTVSASADLPSGEYAFTCTAATSNGGTFAGMAPLGVPMGNWTVGTAKTYTDPRGGTLTVTFADGSVDFKAGANPCIVTVTVNPIGGARTIYGAATRGPAYFSQTNPSTSYRGGSSRTIWEMDTSGVIAATRSLTYDFMGYAGTSGDVILGYGASGSTIYRHANEGNTGASAWTTMATGLGTVSGKGNPVLCPSRHSSTRCYAGLQQGRALRVDGSVKTTIFDIMKWLVDHSVSLTGWSGSSSQTYNGVTAYVPMISGVAESYYDPNLVYVSTYCYGAPYTLFRTENALDAAPTWENITRDAAGRGLVQPIQSIAVHPLTDELFIFSAHGTVMFRPKESHRIAYGITSSLIDDLRAAPGGGYTSTQPI